MSVHEEQRNRIQNKLTELLGSEDAGGLMEMLPRHASSELATRDDVLATASLLRGEMAELRGELRGEMSKLRTELKDDMSKLRTELKGDMTELRRELNGDMTELRSELNGDMTKLHSEMSNLESRLVEKLTTKANQMMLTTIGSVVALAVAMVGSSAL